MFEPDENGVLATVSASAGRRGMAFIVLFGLGALLIYLAMTRSFDFAFTPLLLVLGVLIIWLGDRLRRSTLAQVLLKEDGLYSDNGDLIAPLADIKNVERGAFAMKPSNGFTVVLNTKQPRAWAPGLWWRIGRRVGVGGVTSAGQTKFMAEQIALLIVRAK